MNEHIVRSYDDELQTLRTLVARMGGIAEEQLVDAVKALLSQDVDSAERVRQKDSLLDDLEHEIEQATIVVFARRAPVADDLREIVATLKMSGVLERMGDYAKNIAKRTSCITELSPTDFPAMINTMAEEAASMLREVMDAFVHRDTAAALAVWERDELLDNMHNAAYRQILEQMLEAPDKVDSFTHLVMIAKNLERIGDQATNIAEQVYYALTGVPLIQDRPKNDKTAEGTEDLLQDKAAEGETTP